MLTKPSIVPHFVILYFKLKKMYKSAYMVQIMRSKRSIKEKSKGKKCTLYPTSKNAAEQERFDYIT